MKGFKDLAAYCPEPVPKGWATIWQLTEEWSIGYEAASKRADRLYRKGKLERRRIPNPAGTGSPANIFRPK